MPVPFKETQYTFTELSQPPDLGRLDNHDGKMARVRRASARAMANPSMPMAGPRILPDMAASTSSVPMMGPVQEKDTSTRVNALKKMLNAPDVLLPSHPSCWSTWQAAPFQSLRRRQRQTTPARQRNKIEQCACGQIIQCAGTEYAGNKQSQHHVDDDDGDTVDHCFGDGFLFLRFVTLQEETYCHGNHGPHTRRDQGD